MESLGGEEEKGMLRFEFGVPQPWHAKREMKKKKKKFLSAGLRKRVAGNEWRILNVISEGDDLNGESGKNVGPNTAET